MTSNPLSTLEDMQADHRQWDYMYLAWRVDIERWREEHESTLSELAKLQELVHQHGDALDAHAESLERQQDSLRDHERAIAEFKHKGSGQLQEAMRNEHCEHATLHSGQHAAHERIKKHHHTVLAHLALLRAALEDAV